MSDLSVAGEATAAPDLSEPLSQSVVDAVARAEGVDPLALDVPLYDAVDPDALDALFQTNLGSVDGRVTFEYVGYEVTVTSDGRVTLEADDAT